MRKTRLYMWLMGMMSRLMLSCESAGILICKQQHEDLTFRERTNLKMHLVGCKLCRRFDQDMNVVQNGIDQYNKTSSDDYVHSHLNDSQKSKIAKELERQASKRDSSSSRAFH